MQNLPFKFMRKNKIIETQSNKIFELSEERNQLSDLFKAQSNNFPPSDEVIALK